MSVVGVSGALILNALLKPRASVLKPIIQNSCLQATAQTFQMSLSSSYYLNVGDTIQLNLFNSFTAVTAPSALGIDTFALNTFFTWRYITA